MLVDYGNAVTTRTNGQKIARDVPCQYEIEKINCLAVRVIDDVML